MRNVDAKDARRLSGNSASSVQIRARLLPLAMALSVATMSSAPAATITVNSADDDAASTFCNLRNALTSVNGGNTIAAPACVTEVTGAFGSNDTIVFDGSLKNSTITLTQGELEVGFSTRAIILGSGQTIHAGGHDRALYLNQYANTTINNLTFTGGNAASGGAIDVSWYGSLTLNNCSVTGNAASVGGGISASPFAMVTLNGSTVSGNTASGAGGGVYMARSAGLKLAESTVSGNTANCGTHSSCGGGIHVSGGYLSVDDSTLSGNMASGYDSLGGAVYLGTNHIAVFRNSTITGNAAFGHDYLSGGLWQLADPGGQLTLINNTVTSNTAAGGTHIGGGVVSGVTALAGSTGSLAIENSIIASNTPGIEDVLVGSGTTTLNTNYNLFGTLTDVSPFNNVANHNTFSDSPGLGPLQNNGGLTQTMALTEGSPALRTGGVALLVYSGQSLNYDQRGVGYLRTFGYTVDMGAAEDQGDRIFADGAELIP